MGAYAIFLMLHNINRWIIVLSGLYNVYNNFSGWQSKKEWEKPDNIAKIIFVSAMDVQFLLGLILYYFLSPLTTEAFNNMAAAMKNPEQRFYLVEHLVIMIAALAVAHIGSAKSKREEDIEKKRKTIFIFFAISMVLVFAGIPWSRPLMRF